MIEFPGQLNFMPGFEAFDVTVDPAFPADRQLLATGKVGASTRADTLSRFDIASGEMFDQFALSGTVDIKGLAYVTSTKTLFLDDTVIKATSGTKWDIASVTGGSAAWHIACQGDPFAARVSSASCSWRYAVQNQGSFDTGARTEGTLTTSDFLPVSAGTQLTFFTGFNTELQEGADLKLVEMQTPGTDFRPLLQIVGKGGGFAPQPTNAHATFQFQELDPLFVNPNLVQVTVSLAEFAGNQVKIRFKFDSVDAFANGGEGWYVDDIVVSGSGTKILQISTTAIDPPVSATVNGTSTTMFREFQFGEPLDEGQNIITVEAVQPYTPFLSDTDQVSGFADTTAPVV